MTEVILFGLAPTATRAGTMGLFGFASKFAWPTTLMTTSSAIRTVGTLANSRNQAGIYEYQAAVARQQAEYQRQLSAQQAVQQRRAGEALAGTQRARLAASGVDLTAGSALLLQEDLAGETELNALTVLAQGQAAALRQERLATLHGMQASAVTTRGNFGVATRLLSSVESFAKRATLTNPPG